MVSEAIGTVVHTGGANEVKGAVYLNYYGLAFSDG